MDKLKLHYYGTMEVFDSYTLFLISNTLKSNARLKLFKNQASAKQHPEAECLLFELKAIQILHQRCHPKIKEYILKNKQKNN